MFGTQKRREEMSVEQFVMGQVSGTCADDAMPDNQEGPPTVKGWLVAAIVVAAILLILCFVAFLKIGHLSRDVAQLKGQVNGKAIDDLKAQVAALTRDVETTKQANALGARAKTKMPIKKSTVNKKKIRPY